MRLCARNCCIAGLVLAALGGCSNLGELRGVGASIDSDTRAPTLSLTLLADRLPSARSTDASGEPTAYFQPEGSTPDDPAPSSPDLLAPDWLLEKPLSAAGDCHDFVPSLGRDLCALATWETAGVLLIGGGASLAVRETVDDDIADWTAEHPGRWGKINDVLTVVGNPGHHFAAAAVLWGTSLALEDPSLHSLSGSMMNALVITNASTLLLKLIANSDAPNGEALGWPSGHTSSSVTMAAVLDEYYGPAIGIPAYVLAGAVTWERIDDREHDLSDVIFGAVLGYVVGKVVARNHRAEQSRLPIVPYVNPVDGSVGVGLEVQY